AAEKRKIMATLGPESARPPFAQLGSSPSNQNHVGSANLPPNRGLERALEEAAASGVLNLSCRKLKEFPRTAANHDLSDTVEAGTVFSGGPFLRCGCREVSVAGGLQRGGLFTARLSALTLPLFIINPDLFTPEAAGEDYLHLQLFPHLSHHAVV
ncbi:hypothetical protein GOODEAATRI_015956, partial [Goodea atripinnis]